MAQIERAQRGRGGDRRRSGLDEGDGGHGWGKGEEGRIRDALRGGHGEVEEVSQREGVRGGPSSGPRGMKKLRFILREGTSDKTAKARTCFPFLGNTHKNNNIEIGWQNR